MVTILAGSVFFLFGFIRWFGVAVPWGAWAIFGWISVLLLSDGALLAYEKGFRGVASLLPPAGFVGGFWIMCATARTIFRRMEKNDEQRK